MFPGKSSATQEARDTENRLDTEIPTNDETCEQQQNTIDDERHRTDVNLEVEQVSIAPHNTSAAPVAPPPVPCAGRIQAIHANV